MAHRFEIGTDGPSVLVTAVDGSASSLRAASYAGGLCRRQGAELAVVHVVSAPAAAGLVPGAAGAVEGTLTEIADDLRRQVLENAERVGMTARFFARRGDPYLEICRLCDEVRADGVVVGASAAPGHRLAGSLAVRLVRAGRWPVTVVP